MIRRSFDILYNTLFIGINALRQRRAPYLPAQELRELRDRRLRWMVRYAAESVPFYRDLFRQRGINPAEIRTVEDLDCLPLIDKETVRAQQGRFLAQSKWGRSALPFTSSGTTGEPLTVYHDRGDLLLASACSQRDRDVLGQGFGISPMHRSVAISFPHSASDTASRWLRQSRRLPLGPRQLRLSLLQPVEHVVAAINEHQPEVLIGFGSYLEALFRMLLVRDWQMHMPKLVVYFSDGMTDGGTRLIEEHFGIPVLSQYTAVEAFKLGFTCQERRGFHLNIDLVHLKVVDAQGHPVPKGERGELVISNLTNRGTVLLNYRLRDIAALCAQPCPCGRTLPLLSSLEGRKYDVIEFADGRFVHPAAVDHIFYERLRQHGDKVLQYQLIQHDYGRFELRLAMADRAAFDRTAPGYVAKLRELLGAMATIEAVYHPERLPTGPGGKFRPVASLLREQPL
jgi:phenylacetate-CoA ligase